MSEEKIVAHKDRDERINLIRSMAHLLGFGFRYEDTDLFMRGMDMLTEKGDLTLRDGVKIQQDWQEHWDAYFKKNK